MKEINPDVFRDKDIRMVRSTALKEANAWVTILDDYDRYLDVRRLKNIVIKSHEEKEKERDQYYNLFLGRLIEGTDLASILIPSSPKGADGGKTENTTHDPPAKDSQVISSPAPLSSPEEKKFYCSECNKEIDLKVTTFSISKYGKPLCYEHQPYNKEQIEKKRKEKATKETEKK